MDDYFRGRNENRPEGYRGVRDSDLLVLLQRVGAGSRELAIKCMPVRMTIDGTATAKSTPESESLST